MIKSLSKKVTWLLVFMMVFGVFITPNIAGAEENEKKPPEISYTEDGSYIKANVEDAADKNYVTIKTFGNDGVDPITGELYKDVIRGNIFLTFSQGTDLTSVLVTLEADGFDFTLDGTTVNDGDSGIFRLNLTQENVATLDVSSDPDLEEGSYVITGGISGETIEVKTSISVKYPEMWLEGKYNQPGYPTDPPATNPDTEKVTDAVAGFNTLEPIKYTVSKGTTAMEVLKKYGKDFKMDITGIDQGYISEMGVDPHQQIGEFDINPFSGWMFTVDEGDGWYFPNVGASAKTFTKDTEMIWHFTMAYGADIGAPWGAPDGSTGMPAALSSTGCSVPQWSDSERVAQ